jgi:hypothetical protein
MTSQLIHPDHTVPGELAHGNSVILTRLGQSSHGDVAVTDRLDLEDTTALGDGIECLVHGFE